MKRYQAMQLDNGKYGVIDFAGVGFLLVASGMTRTQAEAHADRLNYRQAWGK